MKRLVTYALVLSSAALALASCDHSPSKTAARATNLVVTASVRLSLLDAAARYHQLPASDYTGLQPHNTYFAFDPATNHYYAAAGLVPSPHSLQAQIGTQDDGGYNLFTKVKGTRTWKVFNDGLGGVQGATCPLSLPRTVLKVWDWKVGSCYPPASE
jgi:hypothetical protein